MFPHVHSIWDTLSLAMGDKVEPRLPDLVLFDAAGNRLPEICQIAATASDSNCLLPVEYFEWKNSNLRQSASLLKQMILVVRQVHDSGFHFQELDGYTFRTRSSGARRTIVFKPVGVVPNHEEIDLYFLDEGEPKDIVERILGTLSGVIMAGELTRACRFELIEANPE